MTAQPDREAELRAHRAALARYHQAALAVLPDLWSVPVRSGGWSPGQITEHLRLTYWMVGREFAGESGLRVRTSWWLRPLLRFKFLGKILELGEIPIGARAPRELQPGPGPFPREASLGDLARVAGEAEANVAAKWDDASAFATHHVFGRLTPSQILRFATVHLDHHARQLPVPTTR